jgi:pyruvate kinase
MLPTRNIICTLGPASEQKEVILAMLDAGMGIARINFSHGDKHQHQYLFDTIRQINEQHGQKLKILQDLEGYRIRVGILKQPITLEKEQTVWMSNADEQLSPDDILLEPAINTNSLTEGMQVFINDGIICLKVIDRSDKRLKLKVENGGIVTSRKGVNIPRLKLGSDILTGKDQEDIAFGLKNKVDYIAQSFVRNQNDILRVVNLVKTTLPDCKVIAKIENREGVENIESIIDACDGIMIARGDLGVSLPIYHVPYIQKNIIQRCNKKEKLVITATQMLESMTEHPRPTRAEVSDVANAVWDGTDLVMLSGETAAGRFPVESVKMMRHIVTFAMHPVLSYMQ